MKNKVFSSFEQAVADIPDGATIMMFYWNMGTGAAQNLIRALYEKGVKDLTIITHCFLYPRVGNHYFGDTEVYSPLILAKQVKKVITAWPGGARYKSSLLQQRIASGEIELELTSHGTLAERIRAGGGGLGGFYTPVGVGTIVAEGKEKRIIDGKEYIFEKPLTADFGFVKAHKADRRGNLIYRASARGPNPLIAMASRVTIAEVDEIVDMGTLDPEAIVTPEIFVHRIVEIPKGGIGSHDYMKSLFQKTIKTLDTFEW